jgi:putative Mn2+ efflux pump MntP
MHGLKVLALAVGLGMDAMSVCMAVGVRWHGRRQRRRLAWHMGLFQFAMPVAGYFLGRPLAARLAGVGHYVAAALVFAVGAKMLWEALRSHPGAVAEDAEHAAEEALHVHPKDPTRGWPLIGLSVATSLDTLVAGLSMGLKGADGIWWSSVVIGVVAGAMALMGLGVSFVWL